MKIQTTQTSQFHAETKLESHRAEQASLKSQIQGTWQNSEAFCPEGEADRSIDMAALTQFGFDRLDPFGRIREDRPGAALAKLAGIAVASPDGRASQIEKAQKRKGLLNRLKGCDPEMLPESVAAGVWRYIQDRLAGVHPPRGLSPHDGLWILQGISNVLCDQAVNAWLMAAQYYGGASGVGLARDHTGLWVGEEERDVERSVGPTYSGGENPFGGLGEQELVRGTFLAWFEGFQPYLAGVASEANVPSGMRDAGREAEWIPSEYGHHGAYRQVNGRPTLEVTTFDERCSDRLRQASSRQQPTAPSSRGGVNWD